MGQWHWFQTSFGFFKKSFIWSESKCSAASFQYILIALNLAYNKNKLYKTLGYWSRGMLNFNFSEKGLGIVSPSHFVHDFPRKMFLRKVRCLIAFTSQDIRQYVYYNSLRLQSVTSYNLKLTMINLIFQINSFCYMIKKSRQKL